MKYLSIFIFFLFGSSFLYGQHGGYESANMPKNGKISGVILDPVSKQFVEYASIALYSHKDSSLVTGTISNQNGLFTLSGLAYGSYYIMVDFIGYEKTKRTGIKVTPQNPEVSLGQIELKQGALKLDEVEISSDKTHVEFKLDKKIINVSQDMTSTSASAAEVLENTPSIQSDIDGNISLRGSSNFQVLVDGKPSVLDGNELLQQIPAATIDHIEIITNPSAKYDPDGIGGIINVILKKQKSNGFNGIVNASYGSYNNYSFDLLMNYRVGKFNFFGGFEINDRGTPGEWNMDRRTTINDTNYYIISSADRQRGHKGYQAKGGFDFDINDKNSMSFSTEYGVRGREGGSAAHYYEYSDPLTSDDYYLNENQSESSSNYLNFNYFYQHIFDNSKHNLTTNIIYSRDDGIDTDFLNEYETNSNWVETGVVMTEQKSIEDDNGNDLRIKVDYTKPIGANGKIESGLQSRIGQSFAEYKLEQFDSDKSEWIENPDYYNDITFTRNIQAGYVTYTNKFAKLEYMAGIRGEYTDRVFTSNILNKDYEIKRMDYFPSLHLSHPLPLDQQIMASYSRRIDRPREYFLDPFPNYVDQQNIRMGNPELEPEYINSYELSYQKTFKKKSFLSVETYYRETNNKIQRIHTLGKDNIMYHTFDNIERDYALGVEVMLNSYLFQWWTLNTTFNMFNYHIEGEILNDEINQVTNTWDIRVSNTFKLPKGTRIQLSGNYDAPSITAQGKRDPFFMANAAIKQDFFNKSLSATLSIRNIFNSMSHSFTLEGPSFYSDVEYRMAGPIFSLNLSYKINNYKQKSRNSEMEMEMEGGGDIL